MLRVGLILMGSTGALYELPESITFDEGSNESSKRRTCLIGCTAIGSAIKSYKFVFLTGLTLIGSVLYSPLSMFLTPTLIG